VFLIISIFLSLFASIFLSFISSQNYPGGFALQKLHQIGGGKNRKK
jgi:hypothetical protein